MRCTFIILICLAAFSARSQIITEIPAPSPGPDIKHENVWTTSVLGAANVFVPAVNIRHFGNAKRKSNAGFLLFPGLVQLSVGVFYKKTDDPTRKFDIAIGASSALICTARLLYKPNAATPSTTILRRWCLPYRGGLAFGFSLKHKL